MYYIADSWPASSGKTSGCQQPRQTMFFRNVRLAQISRLPYCTPDEFWFCCGAVSRLESRLQCAGIQIQFRSSPEGPERKKMKKTARRHCSGIWFHFLVPNSSVKIDIRDTNGEERPRWGNRVYDVRRYHIPCGTGTA